MANVEPNDGHRAIAAWQDHAEVSVITQNVDDLHERAGSGAVHHLHGSLFEFRCARCGVPYTDALPEMPEPAIEVEPPVCDCGGLIGPTSYGSVSRCQRSRGGARSRRQGAPT